MTFIPQRAEQEFYDELDLRLASQPGEWRVLANGTKTFFLPLADFDYLVHLYQQHQFARPVEQDEAGRPMLFFRGIRVEPYEITENM